MKLIDRLAILGLKKIDPETFKEDSNDYITQERLGDGRFKVTKRVYDVNIIEATSHSEKKYETYLKKNTILIYSPSGKIESKKVINDSSSLFGNISKYAFLYDSNKFFGREVNPELI